MKTFKLPTIDKKEPYVAFYRYIARKLGKYPRKWYKMNQSAVYLSPENEETLSKMERAIYPELKRMPERMRDLTWGMHHLQYSPATNPCVQNGYVVVDEDKFWVKDGHIVEHKYTKSEKKRLEAQMLEDEKYEC